MRLAALAERCRERLDVWRRGMDLAGPDPDIATVTGTWTRIEVSGALARAARTGRGDEKGLLALLPQDQVEQHALQLVREHALRAMDAWHLAVAAIVVPPLLDPGSRGRSPRATKRNAKSPKSLDSSRSKRFKSREVSGFEPTRRPSADYATRPAAA